MASQTDLDQGGSFRQYVRRWLGPSVGWVWTPEDNVLPVTAVGTVSPVTGTTLVTLSVAGAVSIQLYDPTKPAAGAMAQPGLFLALPMTIVDIGGNCAAFPATIIAPPGKTILGLPSIDLAEAYGSYMLLPNIDTGNWTQSS